MPRISIRKQDRRPKPLETGAVGRVQGYKNERERHVVQKVYFFQYGSSF